jgi:hypothetical protein
MKILGLVGLMVLVGCSASSSEVHTGRFVLVPEPAGLSKDTIPAGAVALDTQTGQLCFTVQGSFVANTPGIGMCSELAKKKPTGKE